MGNASAEMAEFADNLWKNYILSKIKTEFGSMVSFYRATVVSNTGGTIKVSRPFDDNDGDGFTVNATSQMSGVAAGENVLVFALGKGNAMNQLIVAYADGAIPSGAAGTVNNTWYGTSSTAAGTAAKVVTCADYQLAKGNVISVNFSTANTATAPTLNVNSTGAKAIYVNNAVTSASNMLTWDAGEQMTFIYSGSYYFLVARSSPIKYSSATFTDSLNVTRTVTKQGSRVHMDWGDNYTTTAGSWLTIGTVPEGYRPTKQQRRTLYTYTGLDSWTGQGIVEISTAGVIRIGGSYTGTAVWEIAFDYDV